MKQTTGIFLILSVLLTSCALTDDKKIAFDGRGDAVSMKSEEHFKEHAVNMPSVLKVFSKDRNRSKSISGICFVKAGPESFFDMPCVGVYISLLDSKDNIVLKVKADSRGRFSFSGVEPGKSYHLGVKSKSYKTLSDRVYVSAGVDLLLEIVEI